MNVMNRSNLGDTTPTRARVDHTAVENRHSWTVLLIISLIAAFIGALSSVILVTAQDAATFPRLKAGQRVYDETGTSLTPEQVTALERRLTDLTSVGADAIVYVRALDATPEETLDQVVALQQAWVAQTGADQDNAVAILINRNPGDRNDARAGIYVGSTYDDGNVPRDEQRAIVDEALIPPLRNGDVYGSFIAGLERLQNSIQFGPPQSAFEEWAVDAGSTWFPWAAIGLAVAGFVLSQALFRRRQTTDLSDQPPTTARPGNLTPALGAALASGSPQASAIPATLLDLAGRGALDIEPESEGGKLSKPKIQVRLVDRDLVRDDVEVEVWNTLAKRADDEVVGSKNLQKVAADSKSVRKVFEDQMRHQGWRDPSATGNKTGLILIFLAAAGLAILSTIVAVSGEQWLPATGIVALVALAALAIYQFSNYSSLSKEGQEAAIPWKAYRNGLKLAAKANAVDLDLDAALADAVAMNLGSAMDDQLKAANESGRSFRAFSSRSGTNEMAYFPFWIAFSSDVSSSTGTGSGTVSSDGAGGGGAAGST